jgi:hypothetical protein
VWVNIREKPDMAAFARTANQNGYDVVPTVIMTTRAHTKRLVSRVPSSNRHRDA